MINLWSIGVITRWSNLKRDLTQSCWRIEILSLILMINSEKWCHSDDWEESLITLSLKLTWKNGRECCCVPTGPNLHCMGVSEDGLCSSGYRGGVSITRPIKICLNCLGLCGETKLWSALSALRRQRWWVLAHARTSRQTRTKERGAKK